MKVALIHEYVEVEDGVSVMSGYDTYNLKLDTDREEISYEPAPIFNKVSSRMVEVFVCFMATERRTSFPVEEMDTNGLERIEILNCNVREVSVSCPVVSVNPKAEVEFVDEYVSEQLEEEEFAGCMDMVWEEILMVELPPE